MTTRSFSLRAIPESIFFPSMSLARFISLVAAILLTLSSSMSGKPNFVIFIADDVSWDDFGCYGNENVRTPNIDMLAENGLRFTNAYLTASSCSPSRASIITGRYPHNNGKAAELHLPIADHLPWLPEVLREAGYYSALSGKHHIKRENPRKKNPFDHVDVGRVEGNRGGGANWVSVTQNRPEDRPFFFWFAAYDAHRAWDADDDWIEEKYGPKTRPASVRVPPFLIDDGPTRQDLASYYNEITRFDYFIGEVVEELGQQGVLDNTLIFVLADNGSPFPRAKTRLHDSGMKTALVAHWPRGIESKGVSDSLVSVIDLAPTLIKLAGLKVGPTFQGVSVAPVFKNREKAIRRYAFSEHNWHDYEALGRSVRTKDFLFIANDRPDKPWQGPADSVRSSSFAQLLKRSQDGSLSLAQADVFLAPRPRSELYRMAKDPHQLDNLSGNVEFATVEKRLKKVLSDWRRVTGDSVPDQISGDEFDRQTGNRLGLGDTFRGETPGESNGAALINRTGPK